MKRILCVFAVGLLLLTGCKGNSESQTSTTQPTTRNTIKWCLHDIELDAQNIAALNDALREDGFEYTVELVRMGLSFEKTYEQQVRDYESENGSFDVVSAGGGFSSDAAADFIKSGYFAPLGELSDYNAVPEKLWETVKVNGEIYTVPGLNFADMGIYFYFNRAYVSEQQIANFNGDLAVLGEMVEGLSAKECSEKEFDEDGNELPSTPDFLPIYFCPDYAEIARSLPYAEKGGLLLDNKTHKAVNPYEYAEFVDYARTLNDLYTRGYFGEWLSFSEYKSPEEHSPKDFAVMVSSARLIQWDLNESGTGFAEYIMPGYLENRTLYSMGVAANSENKEAAFDFLKRLYSDPKYANILLEGKNEGAIELGVPVSDVKEFYENKLVSDFADFELPQNEINTDLQERLIADFDKLCRSADFDKTLSEINERLKSAGLESYIDNVNKLLEENNAP